MLALWPGPKPLVTVGVLTAEEQAQLEEALNVLLEDVRARPQQILESDAEDIHSWVEGKLIDKVGQLGKKLHTGRSRNDQVATDLKLWCKDTVSELLTANRQLQSALVETAQNNQDAVMPGYTSPATRPAGDVRALVPGLCWRCWRVMKAVCRMR